MPFITYARGELIIARVLGVQSECEFVRTMHRIVRSNDDVDPGSSPGVVAADVHSAHAQNLPSNLRCLLVDTGQWLLSEERYSLDRSLVQELRNSHLVTSTTRRTQSVISSVHCTKKHHCSCVE